MKISFDWLKDFVDIQTAPSEVADRLTMAGLEVEGMEDVGDDVVLEVNVTPNRPDCLSILGIAREAAAALGLPLRLPVTEVRGKLPDAGVTVEIVDPELCHRYSGRLITGVTVVDSPGWIKARLEKCGIRSLNNNIVDVTNYVLLELGHPLHAFDAAKLADSRIRVARAGQKAAITTLDGVERKLPEDALLIWDSRSPVAVAGIMGGEESSVTSDTVNIFLESAYFLPASIRRTSKKLGLKSESSYRFERGTDIEFLEKALDRAALLIRETGGGEIHEIVDVYPKRFVPLRIEASHERINSLLGTDLSKDEMRNMLDGVGIKTEDRGKVFEALPPAYRRDVTRYVDLAEEIARIYNYDNVPVTLPQSSLSGGGVNRKQTNLGKMHESMTKCGFTEVINYSFMNPADLDLLGLPDDDIRRRHVRVLNPLRQEDSLMRTTLLPALINNLVYNISRGSKDLRLYELSKVFIDRGDRLPDEESKLGGIFYREGLPSLWKENTPAFFMLKGAVSALFGELKVDDVHFVPSEEVFLHGGKSADMIREGRKFGFIGELAPDMVEHLNLKMRKPEVLVFEIDTDILLSFLPETVRYSPVPKYPAVERDVALILDENMTSAAVKDIISEFTSEYIEGVELFDAYSGKNTPEKKKSLAFRIIYRSTDRTLTDDEVETVHQGLVKFILMRTGGEIRG
jgi:phenylalanyl-tRNA synthetase beta chain